MNIHILYLIIAVIKVGEVYNYHLSSMINGSENIIKLIMAKIPDYQFYILMKDVYGEKAPGKIMTFLVGSFASGPNPKPVQVFRGELLTQIPQQDQEWSVRYDGRPPHNFRSIKDTSVTLYGGEHDEYVSLLNGKALHLLEAIEKPYNRFTVFSEYSKLEWGGRLKKGDLVYVKLPTPVPTWSAGAVRYVEPVGSLPGINFGVEIKVLGTIQQWESRNANSASFVGSYMKYQPIINTCVI